VNLEIPQLRGMNVISVLLFLACLLAGGGVSYLRHDAWGTILGALLGGILAQSPRIAKQWERAIVLRLGRYAGLRGPGLFWIVPFLEQVSAWIDQRTITTSFAAEQTLTSDTVPVNVDAVLFWMVYDPEKAALEVQDYKMAVSWAAQTALRDIIGRTPLTVLLKGREQIEADLQMIMVRWSEAGKGGRKMSGLRQIVKNSSSSSVREKLGTLSD